MEAGRSPFSSWTHVPQSGIAGGFSPAPQQPAPEFQQPAQPQLPAQAPQQQQQPAAQPSPQALQQQPAAQLPPQALQQHPAAQPPPQALQQQPAAQQPAKALQPPRQAQQPAKALPQLPAAALMQHWSGHGLGRSWSTVDQMAGSWQVMTSSGTVVIRTACL